MRSFTRRRVLRGGSLALFGALAGCTVPLSGSSDAEGLTFDRLHLTAVYVDDRVDLSMPPEVETVSAMHNARLLVLPGDVDAGAEQAVEWLADDRVLALLGDRAEATWLSWAGSDAFEDTFDNGGLADAEPDPSLVVGARVGLFVKTYRHSWADGPRDRDVLRALDEDLVAIEAATPPG